jgi:hypothetical protein
MKDDGAAARELLATLFERWAATSDPARHLHDIELMEDGEPIPIYAGTSTEGRGSFRFEFMPLAAMQTLIAESLTLIDESTVNYRAQETGTTTPVFFSEIFPHIDRDAMAGVMASTAMVVMLTSIRAKLGEMLEEIFDDGLMIAQVALLATMGGQVAEIVNMSEQPRVQIKAGELEREEKKAAAKRRARLLELFSSCSKIEPPRGKGRPTKVTEDALRAAIKARTEAGGVVSAVNLAGDLEAEESTVRKAAIKFNIELKKPE